MRGLIMILVILAGAVRPGGAAAQERPAPDPLPVVTVAGPTVIAFWLVPAADSVLDADPDLASALDDQQYYWSRSRAPLEAAGIAALHQPGRAFRLREPGRSWLFTADPDSAATGYLIVRPGYQPRVLYRRHFADDLIAAMRALVGVPVPPAAADRAQPPPAPQAAVDRGIGVVYLRSEYDPTPGAARESIDVRSGPRRAAAITAHFVRTAEGTGQGFSYAIDGQADLVPSLLEFDYEIQGLPIDRVTPDRGWARALLGHDSAGRPRSGWIELDTTRVGVELWRERLPAREWLFFADSVPPPVLDTPDGRPLRADTVFAADGGYALHAEEVRGDWMRVRIVSPDDSCGQAVSPPGHATRVTRITRAWVRYIDPAGRPRVWYHTRGC